MNCAHYLSVPKNEDGYGCDWDHSTCNAASVGGHLEVLKWMRADGCPWDLDDDEVDDCEV